MVCEQVDLRNNRMSDAGTALMIRSANENGSVTSLDVSENRVGVESARALVEMLSKPLMAGKGPGGSTRARLTNLTLSRTHLAHRAMAALRGGLASKECRLTHLDLSRNDLGDLTGEVIGNLLALRLTCRLETLNLEWNTIRKVRPGATTTRACLLVGRTCRV